MNRTEDFVDELHQRWTLRHPASSVKHETVQAPRASSAVSAGGVFLSYASEDYDAAARVCATLDAAGIDVWFDRRDPQAGDEFERTDCRRIARSHFFVAVVSRHSLTMEPRFFRFEWREAEQRAKFAAFDSPFVMPVVIDDTLATDERFPAFVTRVHWTRAPSGDLPTTFVKDIVNSYRRVQSPLART